MAFSPNFSKSYFIIPTKGSITFLMISRLNILSYLKLLNIISRLRFVGIVAQLGLLLPTEVAQGQAVIFTLGTIRHILFNMKLF